MLNKIHTYCIEYNTGLSHKFSYLNDTDRNVEEFSWKTTSPKEHLDVNYLVFDENASENQALLGLLISLTLNKFKILSSSSTKEPLQFTN